MMIDSHRVGHPEQFASSTVTASPAADLPGEVPGALAVAVRRELAGFTLDIAFSAPRGLTVLFGPSGAGKSLTLQAIAGLFPLDSARIALHGIAWHDSERGFYLPPQRRHVGYVPQNYALFPHLTVEQNIAFGLKAPGRQLRESRQRVDELVELMQLDGLENRRPTQLSGGQQQRVALARALAPEPLLLLLDEPFSSLDAAVRETLREEMRALHERVHVPIVLVTHDAAEARMLADTVVVIQQGRVLQVGTPDAVFRSPQTRAIAALVGMHTCWSGKVVAITEAGEATQPPPDAHEGHPYIPAGHPTQPRIARISVNGEQGALGRVGMPTRGIRGWDTGNLALQAYIPASMPLQIGQTLELGIRTDEIRIFPDEADKRIAESNTDSPPKMSVPGTVIRDLPKGAFHSISVMLKTGQTLDVPMIAREMHDLGIDVGSDVMVGIPVEAVHVFDNADTKFNSLKHGAGLPLSEAQPHGLVQE